MSGNDSALYPKLSPFHSDYLDVSDGHRLYFDEYGKQDGVPVMFLHGGPGSPPSAEEMRYFNPEIYRVIAMHQRGVGKSTPFCSTEANTTQHLIADILQLRDHLKINDKMHLFGASWGSFLSLAYAIAHADTVASILIRGIFLGTKLETFQAYQLNVARSRDKRECAGAHFPEEWDRFESYIPEAERGDMLKAYYQRLNDPKRYDETSRLETAKVWCRRENTAIQLDAPTEKEVQKALEEDRKTLSTAVLETHYFYHGCFLEDDHVVKHIDAIAALPMQLLQGRYDFITRRVHADKLADAVNDARKRMSIAPVRLTITTGGHAISDEDNQKAALKAIENLADIMQEKQRHAS